MSECISVGLSQSYNHSINGRYIQARDLVLKFNISDLKLSDAKLTASYNRALVQLGLCAFSQGDYEICKQNLDEICSTFRLKELLCQSVPKAALEKEDLSNLMPFYLHLDVDLVETVFMICLLLLEVPYLLNTDIDSQKKQVNKFFLRLWQHYEKNTLYGQPENYRDFIYQAIYDMAKGEWKSCYEKVEQLDLWKKMPKGEAILADLKNKIKEQAFKCFIFSMSKYYHTLKFNELSKLFDLEVTVTKKLIFTLIYKGVLNAKLDAASDSIIFTSTDTNQLAVAG
jgi:translation initiation factor 3 subunit C